MHNTKGQLMRRIWANHWARPIYGSRNYSWKLWLETDNETAKNISYVKYILHPTFERGYAVSADKNLKFWIRAIGWGSFWVKIQIIYEDAFLEEFPYYLDLNQYYPFNGPPELKQCTDSQLTLEELIGKYSEGYRVFSNMKFFADADTNLMGESFVGSDFSYCSFTQLDLAGANFARCNLEFTDFTEAILSGVNFTLSRLSNANLNSAVINNIVTTDWIIDGIKAKEIFMDSFKNKRIPQERDFGEKEFEYWLNKDTSIESIIPPDSPQVFISYDHRDNETAVAINQWLRDHGVNTIIDQSDFIPGSDLFENVIESIRVSKKVLAIYSKNSIERPWPKLERRISQMHQMSTQSEGQERTFLILICIDDSPLPDELKHNVAIMVEGHNFKEVCEKILDGILERKSDFKKIDLGKYNNSTPWKR